MTTDEQAMLDECTAPGKRLTLLPWENVMLDYLSRCRKHDLTDMEQAWLQQIHWKVRMLGPRNIGRANDAAETST